MNTFNLKSNARQSPLAPEYWIVISECKLDKINWNILSKYILEKEKEIKDLDIPYNQLDDGQTLLGRNSLTSRFMFFNCFKWDNKEIIKLKYQLHKVYLYLLSELGICRSKAWIQCWANVLRDGEQIALHSHGVDAAAYLSGHITIQSNNTCTVYVNPNTWGSNTKEIIKPNFPGNVTFFSSYIPHYTTIHTGNKERISIAFDIFLDDCTYMLDEKIIKNLVLFDDIT